MNEEVDYSKDTSLVAVLVKWRVTNNLLSKRL